jgi:hypothetical protein
MVLTEGVFYGGGSTEADYGFNLYNNGDIS